MNILEIENLSKRFSGVTALDNLTLAVEQGSILGLLGPNGAGKTTLLRIINGLLTHDGGKVTILGREVSIDTSRHIGYMPEERGLYDNMTVEDQIVFFGRLKGGDPKRIREVMQEYLELFNLSGQQKRKVKELSKGNQQKVQIVATLAHEPEVVILDEPFSGFDPINGALLQELIDRLNKKGTTIILSSHNMHAVEEMCTDIALIDHGHLLLSGKLQDIKEKHKTHRLLATTSSPLDTRFLAESGLVTEVTPTIPEPGRKGFAYVIKKRPEATNASLLSEICAQSEILQFEEILPTLNDIFLSYTVQDNTPKEQ